MDLAVSREQLKLLAPYIYSTGINCFAREYLLLKDYQIYNATGQHTTTVYDITYEGLQQWYDVTKGELQHVDHLTSLVKEAQEFIGHSVKIIAFLDGLENRDVMSPVSLSHVARQLTESESYLFLTGYLGVSLADVKALTKMTSNELYMAQVGILKTWAETADHNTVQDLYDLLESATRDGLVDEQVLDLLEKSAQDILSLGSEVELSDQMVREITSRLSAPSWYVINRHRLVQMNHTQMLLFYQDTVLQYVLLRLVVRDSEMVMWRLRKKILHLMQAELMDAAAMKLFDELTDFDLNSTPSDNFLYHLVSHIPSLKLIEEHFGATAEQMNAAKIQQSTLYVIGKLTQIRFLRGEQRCEIGDITKTLDGGMQVGFLQQSYYDHAKDVLKGYFQATLHADVFQSRRNGEGDYLDIDHIMRPILDKVTSNYCAALKRLEERNHVLQHQHKQLIEENCELRRMLVRVTKHGEERTGKTRAIIAASPKKDCTMQEAIPKKKPEIIDQIDKIKKEIDEDVKKVIKTLSLSSKQKMDIQKKTHHERRVELLQKNCSPLGLKISEDVKDVHLYCGNNFFDAISLSLSQKHGSRRISPIQLRSDLCQYLRVQESLHESEKDFHIEQYLDADHIQAYIADLAREGVWVDYLALLAMSRMIKHDIVIVTGTEIEEEDICQCLLRVRGQSDSINQLLVLGYVEYKHYIPLVVTDPIIWQQNVIQQFPSYASCVQQSHENTTRSKLVKHKTIRNRSSRSVGHLTTQRAVTMSDVKTNMSMPKNHRFICVGNLASAVALVTTVVCLLCVLYICLAG